MLGSFLTQAQFYLRLDFHYTLFTLVRRAVIHSVQLILTQFPAEHILLERSCEHADRDNGNYRNYRENVPLQGDHLSLRWAGEDIVPTP